MFVTLSALPLIFLLGKPAKKPSAAELDEEITAALD
jgi:hypothetical protein